MNRSWQPHKGVPRGGRGLRLKAGEMNSWEAAYAAEVLAPAKERGEILAYWFEAVTFKIAADVRYTPDFLVQAADGYFEVHEVKGSQSKKRKGADGEQEIVGTKPYVEPQDRIRLQTFADKFPFKARMVWQRRKYEGGGWGSQDFTAWVEGPATEDGQADGVRRGA